jgi:hypothetical protein
LFPNTFNIIKAIALLKYNSTRTDP